MANYKYDCDHPAVIPCLPNNIIITLCKKTNKHCRVLEVICIIILLHYLSLNNSVVIFILFQLE